MWNEINIYYEIEINYSLRNGRNTRWVGSRIDKVEIKLGYGS